MLPGHVAGLYSYDETHIDLPYIAQLAQAEFLRDRCLGKLGLSFSTPLALERPH